MGFVIKTIISLFALTSFCFSCEVSWQNSLVEAKKISTKSKKPILVFISSITCPYCTKMSNDTFLDARVCEAVNAKFVPLSVLDGGSDVPKSVRVSGVPVIAFVDSSEKEITSKIIGFRNANEFLGDLQQRFKGR